MDPVNKSYSKQQLEKFEKHPSLYMLQVVEKGGQKKLEANCIFNPVTWYGLLFDKKSYKLSDIISLIELVGVDYLEKKEDSLF